MTVGSTSSPSTRILEASSAVETTRWAPRSRPLPQRAREVHRRQPRLGRGRRAARERLRGWRFQRRRPHRPLRHGARAMHCSGTTDGTFSEGAPAAGITTTACQRSGGRRCQRRRSARPVRGRLRQPETPLQNATGGFPSSHGRPRPPLPEPRAGRDGPHPVPRGRATGRSRSGEGRLRARRRVHGWNGDGRPDLYVANDTNPNRLYVNGPSPGPGRSGSASWSAPGNSASRTAGRDGGRDRRLQPRRAIRRDRHEFS